VSQRPAAGDRRGQGGEREEGTTRVNRQAWLLGIGLVAAAPPRACAQARVAPGVDVLLTDSVHLILERRIGLITNQTGVDAARVPTIDRLFRFAGTRLVALFAPEHGIRGTYRPGESVRDTMLGAGDTVDAGTGLPIYSLYGPRRAPTPGQLEGLEVLLVDLQDVGARTFTYVSTMLYAMRAAAQAGTRIIVLDRPNPIGCAMQGPVLDTAYASFIGMLPVPLRHGMTMGELARFANETLDIGADLVVVPMRGWRRCMWFDETGLPWVRPSPNLPDLESVAWYPGTVLFEATNLSVGRGTDAPFRQVGAPWMSPRAQRAAQFLGLPVEPVTFTPRSPGDGKYDGVVLRGLRLRAFHRDRDDPVREAMRLLALLRHTQPESLTVDDAGLRRRLGVALDPDELLASDGEVNRVAVPSWERDISRFRERVRPYLLYR
jgi:uncharacterized protein YbbC (DUF1343 family)